MAIITVTRDQEPGFFARSRAEFSQGIRCTECGWGGISNDPHHLRHAGEIHETHLCPKRPGARL